MKNIPNYNSNGYGRHQNTVSRSDEWLTPPAIIRSLGEFDLDPCSPVNRPWDTAKHHYTEQDNGFLRDWFGRVWLNPPYGKYMYQWVSKLARHGNGIALIFARTDTRGFQSLIFPFADSMFFIAGRIKFYRADGTLDKSGKKMATAPSVLCSFGEHNVEALDNSGLKGKHVLVNYRPVIIIGISPSWKNVVSICLTRLNGEASLQELYDLAEQVAPDKVQKNFHFKEKIRQIVQMHFNRIGRGIYKKDFKTGEPKCDENEKNIE